MAVHTKDKPHLFFIERNFFLGGEGDSVLLIEETLDGFAADQGRLDDFLCIFREYFEIEPSGRFNADKRSHFAESVAAGGLDLREHLSIEPVVAPQPLAHLDAQAAQRLRVGPHGAWLRHAVGGCVGGVVAARHADAAAQRVAVGDGLHRRQRGGVGIGLADHHARKGHRLGQLQAGGAGAAPLRLADHAHDLREQGVGADTLGRFRPGGYADTGYIDADGDPFTGAFDFAGKMDREDNVFIADIEYQSGDYTFTSITGWQDQEIVYSEDNDLTPFDIAILKFKRKMLSV